MATKKTNTDNARVPVTLPRGTKYSAFVSVNGVAYNVPAKGVQMVPPEIAEELERSLDAEETRDANKEAMLEQAREKAKRV